MEILLYAELNMFAFIILILIFLNIRYQLEKCLVEQKLFFALLLSNALLLLTETAMWMIDGRVESFIKPLYLCLLTFYYILTPFLCLVWSAYVDYTLLRSVKHLKMLMITMLIPFVANIVLVILSLFKNYMFYIDEQNNYRTGFLHPFTIIICFLYLIFALLFIIKNRNKVEKKVSHTLMLSACLPFLFSALQYVIHGTTILWIGVTISLLILFINLQNNHFYKDYLTEVFNRKQLDYYLKARIQKGFHTELLVGIMIDINAFKTMNDTYGTAVGDQALQYMAQILKQSFSKHHFIARYGADEFVVILEVKDSSGLIKAVNRLKENVNQFNQKKLLPFEMDFCIGADYYNSRSHMTGHDFLKRINHLMCLDRKEKSNT